MTPERLREIAANCEDVSFIASEDNANELRRLADTLEQIAIDTADLLERAKDTWRNREMSTAMVAGQLMDLIVTHCSEWIPDPPAQPSSVPGDPKEKA